MEQLVPPIIGITSYHRDTASRFWLPATYVEAVRLAGGIPVLLPPGERYFAELLQRIDGLIFSGGGDIDPQRYNEALHPRSYLIDDERDQFELELARIVLQQPLPVLGICRGIQLLAVACGEPLIQHVPDEVGHTVLHRREIPNEIDHGSAITHTITLDPTSRLATMMGTTATAIESWHHQAVRRVPPGWRATAWATDGVIEALEHTTHPWMIAVQWHPELTPNVPAQRRLFEALIQAAQERRAYPHDAIIPTSG
ncbi:MAG: gamma-glutamyl-gamma-aminobutyrate hydrolase family protein [Chloroflexaceae bacterium]|nr:gamma-glutamyl-gamma-aminobutyrate hydrolase family protein [Chloroflexaceae bacterium]